MVVVVVHMDGEVETINLVALWPFLTDDDDQNILPKTGEGAVGIIKASLPSETKLKQSNHLQSDRHMR
jgi:hypothetical protein